MELIKAKKLANRVVELLTPHCELCLVAGSIRRNKPEVKDIEIVAVPKTVAALSLFTDGARYRPKGFVDTIESIGKVLKGDPISGRYVQIQTKSSAQFESVNIDLFMPQEHDFWRIFAVRTGSADYSGKVIAATWVKNGWRGTPNGLRLDTECVERNGTFITIVDNPTLPPVWKSEQDFFTWLNIEYLQPQDRTWPLK